MVKLTSVLDATYSSTNYAKARNDDGYLTQTKPHITRNFVNKQVTRSLL